jgi:nitrous oxide reductase accessory protein NosL
MKKFALSLLLVTSVLFSFEMDYDKDTISIVRQMKVAKYPDWIAKIELTNGKKLFFISPKSMMEFYHQPGKWYDIGVKSESDFKEILVTDYSTKRPIKAKGAFFIYGSNVTSPAGDDLVTFNSYAAAEEFSKKHNGKRILNFREVSPALIRLLNGRI